MPELFSALGLSKQVEHGLARECARLLTFLIGLVMTTLVGVAHANEVGDRALVLKPKAKPLFVSNSGSRYWACAGMVNKRLLDSIHNDLTFISQQEGLPLPDKSLCLYSIGEFKLMGNVITTYGVDYYVSESSMTTCLAKDYCADFRSVMFKVKDGEIFRTYSVTSADKKLSRMACTKLDGTVISLDEACP